MLTENDVVAAVAEHLSREGCEILQTRTTLEHGIDVLAHRRGVTLAVEAKGGGSAREGTARYGLHFAANQKRTHIAVAILTAMQVVSEGTHQAGVAFPDDPGHSNLIANIYPALQKLGIKVFLVQPDRTVKLASV